MLCTSLDKDLNVFRYSGKKTYSAVHFAWKWYGSISVACADSQGKEIPMKYVCNTCGYIYDEVAGDPDNGIAPGTKWDDLPADFTCPLCGVGKDDFSAEA